MMMPSHLLGALVLALLWGLVRGRSFGRAEWLLALGFGVVMDLDHFLAAPAYFLAHGAAGLAPATFFAHGAAWQGFMHTPWALALVVPAVVWWRSIIPAAFWGLHMFQDFVVASHWVVWGSPMEFAIVLALTLVAAGLWRVTLVREQAQGIRPPPMLAAAAGMVLRRR